MKPNLRFAAATLVAGGLCSSALADILEVPAQYASIQAAIDAAVEDDEVWVSPGTYFEQIDMSGKKILVRSLRGPGQTTIDAGSASGSVVTFSNGGLNSGTLRGFTLQGTEVSAGILVQNSSPNVLETVLEGFRIGPGAALRVLDLKGGPPTKPDFVHCEFRNNSSQEDFLDSALPQQHQLGTAGGAVLLVGGTTYFESCLFEENEADLGGSIYAAAGAEASLVHCDLRLNRALVGAGILNSASDLELTSCLFSDNDTGAIVFGFSHLGAGVFNGNHARLKAWSTIWERNAARQGGAIFALNPTMGAPSSMELVNCTLAQNQADPSLGDPGAAIHASSGPGLQSAVNSILYFNTPALPPANVQFEFSTVEGITGGTNDGLDPMFEDLFGADLRLKPGSPAIDMGDAALFDALRTIDQNNVPRILNGIIDRGAHECALDPCNAECAPYLLDMDGNETPDFCQIVNGAYGDCNQNGLLDPFESVPNRRELVIILDGGIGLPGVRFLEMLSSLDALLCDTVATDPINAYVSVLQHGRPGSVEVPRTLITLDNMAFLCGTLLATDQIVSPPATGLAPAFDQAIRIFEASPAAAHRQLLVLTNGSVAQENASATQVAADDLRNRLGVMIDIAHVAGFCGDFHASTLDNWVNAQGTSNHDPNRPAGQVFCADAPGLLEPLLLARYGTVFDSDGDGLLDICDACPTCSGDLDGNCVIETPDLLILLAAWGPCPSGAHCPADLNQDGVVDTNDLVQLLGAWGPCP